MSSPTMQSNLWTVLPDTPTIVDLVTTLVSTTVPILGAKINGTLEVTGTLQADGALILTGGLTLNGDVTVGDASTDALHVIATSNFDAPATFKGTVNIGDAATDSLVITSQIDSDVLIDQTSVTALKVRKNSAGGDVFVVDTSGSIVAIIGSVGIGITTPATKLNIAETIATSPRGIMSSQHSATADGARFHLRKSRGVTADVNAVVLTGDTLGKLVASGYAQLTAGPDTYGFLEMGTIAVEAEGTVGVNRLPTRLVISTATDATPSVLTERMRIDSAGLCTQSLNGLGTIPITAGNGSCSLLLTNTTVGSLQDSPALSFHANDYTGGVDYSTNCRIYVAGRANATASDLLFQSSVAGGAWTTRLTISTSGINSAGAVTAGSCISSSVESKSAAGGAHTVVTPTKGLNLLTSTGTGVADFTLADGSTNGQQHDFSVVVLGAGTTITVTPATPLGFTQITFTALGQGCAMRWSGSAWAIVGNNGGTIA